MSSRKKTSPPTAADTPPPPPGAPEHECLLPHIAPANDGADGVEEAKVDGSKLVVGGARMPTTPGEEDEEDAKEESSADYVYRNSLGESFPDISSLCDVSLASGLLADKFAKDSIVARLDLLSVQEGQSSETSAGERYPDGALIDYPEGNNIGVTQRHLGNGAFGDVYRFLVPGQDKPWAMKATISTRAAGAEKKKLDKGLIKEAQLGELLGKHPNINTVWMVVPSGDFENGAKTTLVMGDCLGWSLTTIQGEQKSGADLEELMIGGRKTGVPIYEFSGPMYSASESLEEITGVMLSISFQASCGLAHMAKCGVVHMDVKSENYGLVGEWPNFIVKVIDYGLSAEGIWCSEEDSPYKVDVEVPDLDKEANEQKDDETGETKKKTVQRGIAGLYAPFVGCTPSYQSPDVERHRDELGKVKSDFIQQFHDMKQHHQGSDEEFKRKLNKLHKDAERAYEQIKRDNPMNQRKHDGWSLGHVILEMFSGEKAQGVKGAQQWETYKARLPRNKGAEIALWDNDAVVQWASEKLDPTKIKTNHADSKYENIVDALRGEGFDGMALLRLKSTALQEGKDQMKKLGIKVIGHFKRVIKTVTEEGERYAMPDEVRSLLDRLFHPDWKRRIELVRKKINKGELSLSEEKAVTIESPHPYPNNMNETWEINVPGVPGLVVTFDDRSSTGWWHDIEFFRDAACTECVEGSAERYHGGRNGSQKVFAGVGETPALVISGSQCFVRMKSDYSGNGWGFKLTAVPRFWFDEWESPALDLLAPACMPHVPGHLRPREMWLRDANHDDQTRIALIENLVQAIMAGGHNGQKQDCQSVFEIYWNRWRRNRGKDGGKGAWDKLLELVRNPNATFGVEQDLSWQHGSGFAELQHDKIQDLFGAWSTTSLSQIQSLNLSGQSELRDVSALASCTGLTELNLEWCEQLSDVSALASCTALTKLDLGRCLQLRDRDLSALASCTALTELNLIGCEKMFIQDGAHKLVSLRSARAQHRYDPRPMAASPASRGSLASLKAGLQKKVESMRARKNIQWRVADKDVSKCMGCNVRFNWVTRKHHCRRCHGIFCSKCSAHWSNLLTEWQGRQRVCDACSLAMDRRVAGPATGLRRMFIGDGSHCRTTTVEASQSDSIFNSTGLWGSLHGAAHEDDNSALLSEPARAELFKLRDEHRHDKTLIDFSELELCGQLGKSATARCFRGKLNGGREVAVKMYVPIEITEMEIQRFGAEAELCQRLGRHENIVEFYGLCVFPPRIGLVFEYCELGDLKRCLKLASTNIELKSQIKTCIECARAVAFMHSWTPPFIHRDIKTSNFLVTSKFVIKLADFGQSIRESRNEFTTGSAGYHSIFAGSPEFIAPELIQSSSGDSGVHKSVCYSEKVDMYSLGITLWQVMARGKRPFPKKMSYFEIQAKVCDGGRPNLPRGCPVIIQAMLINLWSGDPELRPSAAQLVGELEDFQILLRSVNKRALETTEVRSSTRGHVRFSDSHVQALHQAFRRTETTTIRQTSSL